MRFSVRETNIPGLTPKRGKVRDIYDFGNNLLLVSSDRISAFDWILPTCIPDKGKVLTQTAAFWFRQLGIKNHLISIDANEIPFPEGTDRALFAGRSTYCHKTQVFPIECIVRGYLSGSGWKEYQKSRSVCGVQLPDGLLESDQLEEPIFTPTTKAETGHDMNISFQEMINLIGKESAEELKRQSLEIYRRGAAYARDKGIIIADTKFEFGLLNGEIILIDEVMTPDSSRFWPLDQYKPGQGQPSYDKQFVRDWLLASDWDRNSTPPELPEEIVEKTREKYIEAFRLLSGSDLI